MTSDVHRFTVDAERCTRCGRCVADCVAECIDMTGAGPVLARPADCIGCQHCLAVCPEAAVSIFGKKPEDSVACSKPLDPEALKQFASCRRSIRQFKPGDVPADVFRDILETSWLAPTGVNAQAVHLAALATREAMDAFRAKIYDRIEKELKRSGREAGDYDGVLAEFLADWRRDGRDRIFRGAPHLVVASTAPDAVCLDIDPIITLSYLDIYAQSRGVGTVWCGFAKVALDFCRDPILWNEAGVPLENRPAYAMLLGLPAIDYPRGVQRGPAAIRLLGVV